MAARPNSRKARGAAWLLAALVFAATLARADDDLPPGFKADPNDPFKDGEGSGGNSQGGTQGYSQTPGYSGGMPPGQRYGMSGEFAAASIKPPLAEEAEGAPIDSSQSVNATLSYVDHEVQRHMTISGGGGTQYGNMIMVHPFVANIQSGLDAAMAPIVARFGVANLQEAIRLKPSPRADNGAVNAQLETYEEQILNEALRIAMTPAPSTPASSVSKDPGTQNQNVPPPGVAPPPAVPAPVQTPPATAQDVPSAFPPPPARAPASPPRSAPNIVLGPSSPGP
jgi:hypothetical protein